MSQRSTRAVALSCAVLAVVGCFQWESRVAAPKMDPEDMTEKCMALVDQDGDGLLSKTELRVTPGLRSALIDLDENKDEQLSRDEILARFKLYVEYQVGLQGLNCTVTYHGRPLVDGHVDLIPEPFMADYIEPGAGDVINTNNGYVEISTNDDLPGVRPGFYRVRITSPSIDIPTKYNEETIYGIEVAPIQQENPTRHFDVKRR